MCSQVCISTIDNLEDFWGRNTTPIVCIGISLAGMSIPMPQIEKLEADLRECQRELDSIAKSAPEERCTGSYACIQHMHVHASPSDVLHESLG